MKHTKYAWNCLACGDLVISNTEKTHLMDYCKCKESAVDAETHCVRLIGEAKLLLQQNKGDNEWKPLKE